MEIKRKKIGDEEIFAKEQALAAQVSALCEACGGDFAAIGYELDLEFGQKENEAENTFSVFGTEMPKDYGAGYVSRALITVKRKKTEEELAEDARAAAENKQSIAEATTQEEVEQLENDETLRHSENELKRAVAFTEAMLIRTYKSFWVEWVSVGEELDAVRTDLSDFLATLAEKA